MKSSLSTSHVSMESQTSVSQTMSLSIIIKGGCDYISETASETKMTTIWDIEPCSLAIISEGCHLRTRRRENMKSHSHRNVGL
jgi:hypothetical protein